MAAVHRTRPVLAILLAFATLAPLAAPQFAQSVTGSGSGGTIGGFDVEYSFGRLTTADSWRDIALALAIAAGAAAVWAASDRRVLVAGVALAAAGLSLTPVAFAREQTTTVTAATDRAVRPGMTRDQVRAVAGRPAGTGEATRGTGERLPCLVYLGPADARRLYCFTGDRLEVKL
jgi:hypothetical protein